MISSQSCTPWVSEAPLQLPFVAHLSQSITFLWCQRQIDFHTNKMQDQRQPHGHAEAHAQASSDLLWAACSESCVYNNESISCTVGCVTLRVESMDWSGRVVYERNLVARPDGMVGTYL